MSKIIYLGFNTAQLSWLNYEDSNFEFNVGHTYTSSEWGVKKMYISEPKPYKNALWRSYKNFIIPDQLLDSVKSSLVDGVQLLPADVEDKGINFILNPLINGNSWFDPSETCFHTGMKGKDLSKEEILSNVLNPESTVFYKSRVKAPLFFISHYCFTYLFGTKGIFPEEKEFISLVLNHNIKGIHTYECPLI